MVSDNPILFVQQQIFDLDEFKNRNIDRNGALSTFWRKAVGAFRLIEQEREILLFAFGQWAVIVIAYMAWTLIIGAIPDDVWKAAAEDAARGTATTWIANIVFVLWSFFIVGIAALPIGVLSACMGASHMLRRSGRDSTIDSCLEMAAPNAYRLWTFYWIDGWITVNRIFDRLPRKNDYRTPAQKALEEALYYAWKVGTAGVLPGLILGKTLIGSGKSSIGFVRHKFRDIAMLRAGYSALCWVFGIAAYFGAVFFAPLLSNMSGASFSGGFMGFLQAAGLPIGIALVFVVTVLRPIYVIAVSDLYMDYLEETGQRIELEQRPSQIGDAILIWCLLASAVIFLFVFREQLGIIAMISRDSG